MEIFFGQATRAEARIYARLAHARAHEARIQGTVRGPICHHARTLPATVALHDVGVSDDGSDDGSDGPWRLAEAVLPDPCFWTPGHAYLYDVAVQTQLGAATHARAQRQLGICPLGTRGRHLHLDGQRWVVRAASGCEPTPPVLEACRQTSTALVVEDPSDELLEAASRQGILLLVRCAAPRAEVLASLARYTEFAAVRFVILDNTIGSEMARFAARHRMLLVQRVDTPPDRARPHQADALMMEASQLETCGEAVANGATPIFACRAAEPSDDVARLRAACDRLQRSLAPTGDFAGYIV